MTRLLLTLAILAVFALFAYGMLHGWRNRAQRQAAVLPPFPKPPAALHGAAGEALLPATSGVYVGTTTGGNWQDRIAFGDIGYRAAATLQLSRAGLLVDRIGARPLWIPAESIQGARLAKGLANKVIGTDGLLVVTWKLGDTYLDTGFSGDDKNAYRDWVAAVAQLVGTQGKATQ